MPTFLRAALAACTVFLLLFAVRGRAQDVPDGSTAVLYGMGAYLQSLDGKRTYEGKEVFDAPQSLRLAPGRHSVGVRRDFGGAYVSSLLVLEVEAGRSYVVRYEELDARSARFWIEDLVTHARVGEMTGSKPPPRRNDKPVPAWSPLPKPDRRTAVLEYDPDVRYASRLLPPSHVFEVVRLDGIRRHRDGPGRQGVVIKPGPRKVGLRYQAGSAFVASDLALVVEAGHRYVAHYRATATGVGFHIVDDTTQRVVASTDPQHPVDPLESDPVTSPQER